MQHAHARQTWETYVTWVAMVGMLKVTHPDFHMESRWGKKTVLNNLFTSFVCSITWCIYVLACIFVLSWILHLIPKKMRILTEPRVRLLTSNLRWSSCLPTLQFWGYRCVHSPSHHQLFKWIWENVNLCPYTYTASVLTFWARDSIFFLLREKLVQILVYWYNNCCCNVKNDWKLFFWICNMNYQEIYLPSKPDGMSLLPETNIKVKEKKNWLDQFAFWPPPHMPHSTCMLTYLSHTYFQTHNNNI